MPMQALTGTRLRERRLALGVRQAEIAEAAGISASYLNLIEHNRRRVRGDVLAALAAALGVPAAQLAEGAEGGLADDLRAAAAAVAGAGGAELAEVDRVEEFAGRFPGWAGVVVALHARMSSLERAVEALNDRMTHDPHLSESLHEVLSALSSVRSTAAILAETEEIEPEWRARFHRNMHEDSERMAAGAEALVAYLDGSEAAAEAGIAAPLEEMEAWLSGRGWALPELEDGRGETLGAEVGRLASGAARELAAGWLAQAAADAVVLPMADLAAALEGGLPDPLRLAARFAVGVEVVFRRLALMPGRAYGLVSCDGSGTLLFRRPTEGFPLPRFGAACPLWPLYAALGHPGRAVLAEVAVAGRRSRRFRVLAHAGLRHPEGFGGVELREAHMLVLPVDGGAAPTGPAGPLVVGSTCRICPKSGCPARREPSIVSLG
ncbi:helix-turn-helix transcriptional regulator [Paragemmobacter straminiformis]|uniref:Helix-turn-helix domain-containing protein n=1 Tax=Paragemmobacter straminiformis TaxID=2045119 RepID=A0A842I882_9RHOB|nr:helix-turn-helix transcriptional regulator [Gemmobacter straminiformis]MBC2835198.1 helix-turn-helix domain-containing protein [Gemmobacter straminiformis]